VSQPLDYQSRTPRRGRRPRAAGDGAGLGFALGVVFTFPAMLLALMSAGGGHGAYAAARMLYPFPLLLAAATRETAGTSLLLLTAFLQWPIEGALIGAAIASKRPRLAFLVAAAHLSARRSTPSRRR
jgi:hypothetical protein